MSRTPAPIAARAPDTAWGSETPSRPDFSIVMPTRNRAAILERTLASVLGQSHRSWEVWVVDDGSDDDTESRVRGYGDHPIRYVRQTHRGPSAARNLGIRLARGRFVTFLDSDDEAEPGWLATFMELGAREDVGVVCCGARVVSEGGARTTRPDSLGPAFDHTVGLFLAGTYAVRRSLLRSIGGFDEELSYSENTELGFRLVDACRRRGLKVAAIDRALIRYHRRETLLSEIEGLSRRRLAAVTRILQRHGEVLREDRRTYGSYCRIGGVAAARLGDCHRARQLFLKAVRTSPWDWRALGQTALTLLPSLGRRVWFRSFR